LPSEPSWLPIEVVVELNRTLVAMTGERHVLRDRGLLEGALARPQNAFAYGEDDIVVLGVRLMAGIALAHAFEQGNKRTAFAALRLFLHPNGFELAIEDSEAWADQVIALIERRSTEEDFVRAVRPYIVPLP
jgi:death-on-curing protein